MVDKVCLSPMTGDILLSTKRGSSGPIVTTSDEEDGGNTAAVAEDPGKRDEFVLKIPVKSDARYSPTSPSNSLDHDTEDYEFVNSPGSHSTASEPMYERPPGFTQRAREVTTSRIKKKKTASALMNMHNACQGMASLPLKPKRKKEPLPMKQRALPQSFFQQPNIPNYVSPANIYRTSLPPLCTRETEEDVASVRPVTPPMELGSRERGRVCPRYTTERRMTNVDSDLLFRLFNKVSVEKPSIFTAHASQKRIRSRRLMPQSTPAGTAPLLRDDPYMMDAVSEKLLPQLSSEQTRQMNLGQLQLITFREGDKNVTLPTLAVNQQAYAQILSELVNVI